MTFAASLAASAKASTFRVRLCGTRSLHSSATKLNKNDFSDLVDTIRRSAASSPSQSAPSGSTLPGGASPRPADRFAVASPASRAKLTPTLTTPSGNEIPKKAPHAGQHLAPHDLSYDVFTNQLPRRAPSLLGPPRKEAIKYDHIHKLGLKPGKPSLHDDSYKNGALLSSYVSELGKILPRSQTNLTWKSQRNIGKAIRRARAMGILPVLARTNLWKAYNMK